MVRSVGGVRKSIHQSWLAKEFGLGLLCWGFRGVQQEIPKEAASTLQIGFRMRFGWKSLVLSKSGQWHLHQNNAPLHNSILVTDYLTKMGINTVPQPPYSPDLAPCDFWWFSKLRGCRYETVEEMKEGVTKVSDTLTQEDFHEVLQKLLER